MSKINSGRILQIGIHKHNGVAAGRIETGGSRDLMTKVPRETQDFEASITLGEFKELLYAAVGTAIVDQDDFERGRAILPADLRALGD